MSTPAVACTATAPADELHPNLRNRTERRSCADQAPEATHPTSPEPREFLNRKTRAAMLSLGLIPSKATHYSTVQHSIGPEQNRRLSQYSTGCAHPGTSGLLSCTEASGCIHGPRRWDASALLSTLSRASHKGKTHFEVGHSSPRLYRM